MSPLRPWFDAVVLLSVGVVVAVPVVLVVYSWWVWRNDPDRREPSWHTMGQS